MALKVSFILVIDVLLDTAGAMNHVVPVFQDCFAQQSS